MSTFILVHGSWHGAWCFEKVAPLLERAGHTVIAPDLPGHGQDNTPLKTITLNSYVNCIRQIVEKCDEKVILVGHSLAGVIISQVAEFVPEKIQTLIYVAGFLPVDGESMFMCANLQPPTRFSKMMKKDVAANAFHFPVHAVKEFAYNKCAIDVVEKLKPLLCVEPLMPSDTPVSLGEKFNQIPRIYIECLYDNAIRIETQRKMHARIPCTIYTLACDHSPFYSDPQGLVEVLLSVDPAIKKQLSVC